jgi:hypothetical protein
MGFLKKDTTFDNAKLSTLYRALCEADSRYTTPRKFCNSSAVGSHFNRKGDQAAKLDRPLRPLEASSSVGTAGFSCGQSLVPPQTEKASQGSLFLVFVGTAGFEPTTPCTPCKCATGLRHVPKRNLPRGRTPSNLQLAPRFPILRGRRRFELWAKKPRALKTVSPRSGPPSSAGTTGSRAIPSGCRGHCGPLPFPS